MSRIYSPKEKAVYEAVLSLFSEGADLNCLTVSEITRRAGIGKGTAYEYFSDKEEMIAKALFYHTREFCQKMYEHIKEEKDLYHKIEWILLKMEKKIAETSCIFRLVHVITDNSAIGRKLRELVFTKEKDEILAEDIIRLVIQDECGEKMLPQEKMLYLSTSVLSRIICHAMLLNGPYHQGEYQVGNIREMLCGSICREVQEMIQNQNQE